ALALAIAGVASADEPAKWLERMNHALTTLSYDGTFAHWESGKVEMLHIIHRVQGFQPLGDGAVLDAVDDVQHLHLAAFPVRESAVVAQRRKRVVHALEPLGRLVGARDAGDGQGERQPADTLATSDSGSHCLARLGPADPTGGACWRFPAHSPSAPRADCRGSRARRRRCGPPRSRPAPWRGRPSWAVAAPAGPRSCRRRRL